MRNKHDRKWVLAGGLFCVSAAGVREACLKRRGRKGIQHTTMTGVRVRSERRAWQAAGAATAQVSTTTMAVTCCTGLRPVPSLGGSGLGGAGQASGGEDVAGKTVGGQGQLEQGQGRRQGRRAGRAGSPCSRRTAASARGRSPRRQRRAHEAVQHRLQPPGRHGGRQGAPKAQPPALLRGGAACDDGRSLKLPPRLLQLQAGQPAVARECGQVGAAVQIHRPQRHLATRGRGSGGGGRHGFNRVSTGQCDG